jgi:hypothetical protein
VGFARTKMFTGPTELLGGCKFLSFLFYQFSLPLYHVNHINYIVQKIKMIYLTHTISVINYVLTVVFYVMRRTKLDHTCIYSEEYFLLT